MKPCWKNRKPIAGLVLGSLSAERATVLRRHLELCPGCRHYFTELSRLTATVEAAKPDADIPNTAAFHQRFVARIKTRERIPQRETLFEFVRANLLNWRVALPGATGIAVLVALLLIPRHRPDVSLPLPPDRLATSAPALDSDIEPSIANYQTVAQQSLDQLDQLLNEQGRRNLPPAPIYSASTFATATKTD
jgi:hypothetical protein